MARHLAPTAAAAAAAAERIIDRRRRCDDPDRDRIPDDPFGIAEYAASHLHIPADELARDLTDVVIVLDHQRPRLDRAWLATLRAHRPAGLTLLQMAKLLGLRSRQAVEQWMCRLEAATTSREGKVEKTVRDGRRRDRAATQVARTLDQKLRALVVGLLAERDAMPEHIADDLYADILAGQLGRWPAGEPSPQQASTVRALQFLLGQLTAAIADGEIPTQSRLAELAVVGVDLVGARDDSKQIIL